MANMVTKKERESKEKEKQSLSIFKKKIRYKVFFCQRHFPRNLGHVLRDNKVSIHFLDEFGEWRCLAKFSVLLSNRYIPVYQSPAPLPQPHSAHCIKGWTHFKYVPPPQTPPSQWVCFHIGCSLAGAR